MIKDSYNYDVSLRPLDILSFRKSRRVLEFGIYLGLGNRIWVSPVYKLRILMRDWMV